MVKPSADAGPRRRHASRVWLFDLDNTLHNASASSFRRLDKAMNAYIGEQLRLSPAQADALRHEYWRRYGATLLGLIRHHGVRMQHFLHHTHRLPGLEAELQAHPQDLAVLHRLPGRRYILTNAPMDYTLRVLQALGMRHLFDGVISIEQMRMFGQLRPKPDARMFKALAARLKVHPRDCVLVEDTLVHQKAAHAVGMRTAWMQRWARQGGHGPEKGARMSRRPAYVYARIRALQPLLSLP
ncbi:pyrimidine 5'-nucleotidase [Ideonella livida]|uniref:Pyrimidine 5'-nucleotidase n=1 Tax=Ideonella livida TaxID=2707176 RepID=A0A7C9TIA7_9BURK|nr:pyrimidine 5'-nucleotidase [Ideonella livida]NDY89665.1 pyrimidine 5'-nucleotidase [Ideonella livida]